MVKIKIWMAQTNKYGVHESGKAFALLTHTVCLYNAIESAILLPAAFVARVLPKSVAWRSRFRRIGPPFAATSGCTSPKSERKCMARCFRARSARGADSSMAGGRDFLLPLEIRRGNEPMASSCEDLDEQRHNPPPLLLLERLRSVRRGHADRGPGAR